MSPNGYLFFFEILFYAGYAWIAGRFIKNHLNCRKHAEKIFPVLLFLSYVTGNMICLYISYLAGALLFHFILFGLTLLLFQAETEKKLLTAALLTGCMEFTNRFTSSGAYFLLLMFSHKPGNAAAIHQSKHDYFIQILQFAVFAAAVHRLEKPLAPVLSNKIKKWYLMLAIPLMTLVVILDLAEWGATKGIMVRGEDRWNPYYNQLLSHGANLLLSFLGMCAACFYIFGMHRIYMEQKRKEQYQAKIEVYKMLEEQYRQMERLRHDMKNHIIGLQGLLEQKEWEKMKDYLQQMAEAGALGGSEEATGNQVVDALLYQKQKEAKRKEIQWEASMQVPKECGIDDFDFCILIGNILDNAIEACEKLEETAEKFITIRSGIQKSFFLLEVKNSTTLEDIRHIVYTDKTGSKKHGIGLLNILETVQKYNGTMDTELNHQIFTISVLLPIQEP